MQQNINLYQVEEKREKFDFRTIQMVQALGLFGIGLLLMTTYEVVQSFSSSQELKKLTAQQIEATKHLQAAESKVTPNIKKEEISKQVQSLEAEQRVGREVLTTIVNLQQTQSEGFAKYFKALGMYTVPGIWLTKFGFLGENNMMSLEGKTWDHDRVPKLIEALSSAPELSGKKFKVFKLSLDKKTSEINFSLESSPQILEAEPVRKAQ